MHRLRLVRHAATACVRRAAFPLDEPLDEGGRRQVSSLAAHLVPCEWTLTSPARRARETAEAAELAGPETDALLAECDFGTWAGRSLAEVSVEDPAGVRAWLADPEARPHGGESLTALVARMREFLASVAGRAGTGVVVTHGGPVRAMVVLALEAPLSAFWRIEVAPASITELCARDGRWSLARLNWQPEPGSGS
jgi:broad specificity phosphatase PhoE